VFLWFIIQCHSGIFKFVATTQTLTFFWKHSGRKHSVTCDGSHSHSFCLQKSDHRTDLELGTIFNHTGHFLCLTDTWMEYNDTGAATSLLPDVPTSASDVEMSRAGHM
jgi:hypothetical protein